MRSKDPRIIVYPYRCWVCYQHSHLKQRLAVNHCNNPINSGIILSYLFKLILPLSLLSVSSILRLIHKILACTLFYSHSFGSLLATEPVGFESNYLTLFLFPTRKPLSATLYRKVSKLVV
ncbi:unnamed protein product [Moneuplotes crassus]|uniref:Uncharacterized protein n=1 Tax=Euplotes crassus TaxID=5936 RepID=A0AAD1Y1U4_EUPCR|nr:unnamed protein product [Moneuplotes crassus]